MEKFSHFIGADLSKRSIDFYCLSKKSYLRIDNSTKGFKELRTWINQLRLDLTDICIVMEHTGMYGLLLEHFLHDQKLTFCKVSALEIKRSGGLQRGKSDKVDAMRIATYGSEKYHKLIPHSPSTKALERLKLLRTTRHQLVKQRAGLICMVKEFKNIGISKGDLVLKAPLDLIAGLDKQIEKLDTEIQKVIQTDEKLAQNYKLLVSVRGIGKVVAVAILVKTQNFTRFTDPRKFACFCGIAPFEHTSGSSVKGRNRVSHMADKEMKSLLDLAAKVAARHDKALKEYYEIRVQQGKSKMSTINNLRNKVLYRAFAVIKRQTPYVEEYAKAA
jgi:transposase